MTKKKTSSEDGRLCPPSWCAGGESAGTEARPPKKIMGVRYIACLFALLCIAASPADLENKLKERMKSFGAQAVGIYYEGANGKKFELNADEIFHAASTMKVPVMMEVFRQVEQGKLKLEQPVKIKNRFNSIIDGSPYSLTVEDDSDQEIYKMIGQTVTLRNLIERMINQSSNLATNIVIEIISSARVKDFMQQIGAAQMNVLRGVEDIKAYEAGKNNTTNARSLAACYKAILNPKLFEPKSRDAMLEILRSQHSVDGIPAGIRAKEKGLKVANKDGWIPEINHDSGIVQDPKGGNSILVVLTRGVKEEARGQKLVATLAGDVWTAFHEY